MPTPPKSATIPTSSHPADAQPYIPSVSTHAVDTERRLPIRNPSPPFLFFISADKYAPVRGELLPSPIIVPQIYGVGGIGPHGEWEGAITMQTRMRRLLVAPDIEVTAWGAKVRGYQRPHDTIMGVPHYAPVWARPYRLGSRIYWERDEDGWVAFLRTCHAMLGGKVDPAVEQKSLRHIQRELEYLRRQPPHDYTAAQRRELLESIHPALAPAASKD